MSRRSPLLGWDLRLRNWLSGKIKGTVAQWWTANDTPRCVVCGHPQPRGAVFLVGADEREYSMAWCARAHRNELEQFRAGLETPQTQWLHAKAAVRRAWEAENPRPPTQQRRARTSALSRWYALRDAHVAAWIHENPKPEAHDARQ